MRTIRVYEPALCCDTGVCGPDVDQSLVTFSADLKYLKDAGADVQRHNLANDPSAFVESEAVREFLQVIGSEGLPLTTVDGVTVMTGGYPTREQLVGYVGLNRVAVPIGANELGLADATSAEGGCCASGGCC